MGCSSTIKCAPNRIWIKTEENYSRILLKVNVSMNTVVITKVKAAVAKFNKAVWSTLLQLQHLYLHLYMIFILTLLFF